MESNNLKKAVNIFAKSEEIFSSPRITKELRVNGWTVSMNQVAKIIY